MKGLLSGVLFPIEYLPDWLQMVSWTLPTTHALHALRLSLTQNASMGEISQQLILLLVMSLVTLPLGLLAVRFGFDRARKAGTLAHY